MTEIQKMYQTSEKEKEPLKWPKNELINPASAARISLQHYEAYTKAFYKHQEVKRAFEECEHTINRMQKAFDLGMLSDLMNLETFLKCRLHDLAQHTAEFNRFGIKAFQLGSAPSPVAH